MIRHCGYRQRLGVSIWQPFLPSPSFVQLEQAIDPVNSLVIPLLPPTPQDLEPLAEPIGRITLYCLLKPCNDFIIFAEIDLIPINGITDANDSSGAPQADAVALSCIRHTSSLYRWPYSFFSMMSFRIL